MTLPDGSLTSTDAGDLPVPVQAPACEPVEAYLPVEILVSLTRASNSWLARRHVFRLIPDAPVSTLAVALCSHTAPSDSLTADDRRVPMCPPCADLVMEAYLDEVGLDQLVWLLGTRPERLDQPQRRGWEADV